MRSLVFMGPLARPEPAVIEDVANRAVLVDDLLAGLGYTPAHRRFLTVSSQGRRLSLADPLPPDGEIVIALPLGGG